MIIYDRNCLFTFLTTAHSIFWLPELRPPVALGKRPGESCRIIQQKPFILNLPSLADTVGKSPKKSHLICLTIWISSFCIFFCNFWVLNSWIPQFLDFWTPKFLNSWIKIPYLISGFFCLIVVKWDFLVNFNNCGFPPEIFH